jgi:hypothetical protein
MANTPSSVGDGVAHSEADWLGNFLLRSKRERYLGFLLSPKRRQKFIDILYHFDDFEPSCVRAVPSSRSRPEDIEHELKSLKAPQECYLVSTNRMWDQRTMPLDRVLKEVGDGSNGTIVCCIPGRLAYFVAEGPHHRYILRAG